MLLCEPLWLLSIFAISLFKFLSILLDRVRKAPPGSAVFETLSDEVYYGVVVERLGFWKQYGPGSNGVVLFERNGLSEKLTFGANDLEVSFNCWWLGLFWLSLHSQHLRSHCNVEGGWSGPWITYRCLPVRSVPHRMSVKGQLLAFCFCALPLETVWAND